MQTFFCVLLLSLLPVAISTGWAQPFFFGAADAPNEYVATTWWQQRRAVEVGTGISLIGPQWRGAAGIAAEYARPGFSARLNGMLRAGPNGLYEPDVNEPYDALRLVEYVRYNPGLGQPLYARVGPIENLRLGNGHLVNFFSSQIAWDQRTTGAEVAVRLPALTVDAFSEDVRLNGLVGAAVQIRPLPVAGLLGGVQVGGTYVRDRSSARGNLEAYSASILLDLIRTGGFEVRPYVAGSHIVHHGDGVALGVLLENPNLLDAARVQGRVALTYSGQAFLPGYFGSFYSIRNPGARIINSDQYLADALQQDSVGVSLRDVRGGSGFTTEFRLVVFQRFQIWHSFYRHYGTQALSSYHLRLYFQQPEQLEVGLGIDREGLRSFLSLFNQFGDQSALVLTGRYNLFGPLVVGLDTRYTFEKLGGRGGTARFLAQRRFEPYAAARFLF